MNPNKRTGNVIVVAANPDDSDDAFAEHVREGGGEPVLDLRVEARSRCGIEEAPGGAQSHPGDRRDRAVLVEAVPVEREAELPLGEDVRPERVERGIAAPADRARESGKGRAQQDHDEGALHNALICGLVQESSLMRTNHDMAALRGSATGGLSWDVR